MYADGNGALWRCRAKAISVALRSAPYALTEA